MAGARRPTILMRWSVPSPQATTTSCCSPFVRDPPAGCERRAGMAASRSAGSASAPQTQISFSSALARPLPRVRPAWRRGRCPWATDTSDDPSHQGARPPVAGCAAAHRRHPGTDGRGLCARHALRPLASCSASTRCSRSASALPVLNLNRVAVLLGVYSNLPWVIAPYYAIATMVGARLTRHRIPRGFGSQLRALFDLSMLHRRALAPPDGRRREAVRVALCCRIRTLSALLLAAAAYQIALAFVTSRRRLQNIIR